MELASTCRRAHTGLQFCCDRRAVPMVRIHFPPAERSVSLPHQVSKVENSGFPRGCRGWLGGRVGRDAQGFRYRANRRQYLCRAIFQYRSAADVVGENAASVPTKVGNLR
jgi:hypothetical protein